MEKKNLHISLPLIILTAASLCLAGEAQCNTCEQSDDPIIRSVVDETSSDAAPAVEAAINYAITKTKEAMESTAKAVEQNEKSEICEEMYEDAVSDLNESIADLKSNNTGGLRANLLSAMTYYTGCDDAYDESGEISPFAPMNDALERLIQKCLALVSKLA